MGTKHFPIMPIRRLLLVQPNLQGNCLVSRRHVGSNVITYTELKSNKEEVMHGSAGGKLAQSQTSSKGKSSCCNCCKITPESRRQRDALYMTREETVGKKDAKQTPILQVNKNK
jgi:hypothetical protein